MTPLYWAVLLVTAQRLGELAIAKRNESRLLAKGGVETGKAHYPLIVGIHAAWLAALLLFVPANAAPSWLLLGFYLLLQIARYWVIRSLGRYWTTRIIRVAGAPLVRHGPYRYVRHPNYIVVALEIAVLPAAFGAWWIAVIFSALNAFAMMVRIPAEDRALNSQSTTPQD